MNHSMINLSLKNNGITMNIWNSNKKKKEEERKKRNKRRPLSSSVIVNHEKISMFLQSFIIFKIYAKIKYQIPPAVLFNSSCKIFALLSFFLCYSRIVSINFSFEFKILFNVTFLRSNKNFYGWRTSVVNFTFRVCPFEVYFEGDDVFEVPCLFEGEFLELLNPFLLLFLNLEAGLKFDLNAELFPWFIVTVFPKSGISKFLS